MVHPLQCAEPYHGHLTKCLQIIRQSGCENLIDSHICLLSWHGCKLSTVWCTGCWVHAFARSCQTECESLLGGYGKARGSIKASASWSAHDHNLTVINLLRRKCRNPHQAFPLPHENAVPWNTAALQATYGHNSRGLHCCSVCDNRKKKNALRTACFQSYICILLFVSFCVCVIWYCMDIATATAGYGWQLFSRLVFPRTKEVVDGLTCSLRQMKFFSKNLVIVYYRTYCTATRHPEEKWCRFLYYIKMPVFG